jgi:presenilin-like A22 family membrane protease
MELTKKMMIYSSLMYVLIFILAFAYHSYIFQPTASSAAKTITAQAALPSQQKGNLEALIIELVFITIIGAIEVKYKPIRRFHAWLKTKPKLKILFILFVMAMLVALSILLVNIWFGIIVAILILIFTFVSTKVMEALLISTFTFLGLGYLLILSPIGLLPSIVIYAVTVLIITYLIAEHKSKNVFNILCGITCATIAIFFGVIIVPYIMVILLVVLAIYDYIAVFITKHMTLMASAFMTTIPIAFVIGDEDYIQKRLAAVNKDKKPKQSKKPRGTVLGGGDIMLPSALFTSFIFVNKPYLAIAGVIGAIIGIYLNMLWLKKKKTALPAIPLIAISMFICIGIAMLFLAFF